MFVADLYTGYLFLTDLLNCVQGDCSIRMTALLEYPRWRPRNGCDGRLMVKKLITTIQVNFGAAWSIGTKFTCIVIIKIFTINLPSQPFLGRHLGFHIFFHHSLFEGRTLFLQLGCFGLDSLLFVFVYPKAGLWPALRLF